MAKFKVGDRVRVIRKPYCLRLSVGEEITIKGIVPCIGPTLGQLYSFDGGGVYEVEIELVADPEIPLFRKGDKVVVEYEVIADEPQRSFHADRHVKVTAAGVQAAGGVTRLAEFLAAGSITRAPEPPYVPKPGDVFSFSQSNSTRCLCVFIDDKSMMYENCKSGYRYVCTPSMYTFKKDTD